MEPRPFHAHGLRFGCTRCSACCRGSPGFVFLSSSDLLSLLSWLKIDSATFLLRYARLVDAGTGYLLSLQETATWDCIFWSDTGCTVYPARPIQCSTYPFWQGIVDSQADWEREAMDCPGINNGDPVPVATIEDALYARRAAGRILLPYTFDPQHDAHSLVDSVSGYRESPSGQKEHAP